MKKLVFLISLVCSLNSYAGLSVGELTGAINNYLNCDKYGYISIENAACQVFNSKLKELMGDNIRLSEGDILYRNNNLIKKKEIDGGCSHTVDITGGYIQARLKEDTHIDLSGNFFSIDDPLLAYIFVNVDLYGKVKIKEEWGTDIFGCQEYASDTWYIDSTIKTRASSRVMIGLEPTDFYFVGQEMVVTITPIVDVNLSVENLSFTWDSHGRSKISGVWTAATSFVSAFSQPIIGFDKDDLIEGLEEGLIYLFFDTAEKILQIATVIINYDSGDGSILEKEVNDYLTNLEYDIDSSIKSKIFSSLGIEEGGSKSIYLQVELAEAQQAKNAASALMPILHGLH